ncbi:MAG: hypothetical protein ACFE8U_10060 [Candidatus Hermodarchaeota archaeon]
MKCTQTGTFKKNYLEKPVTIKPMEKIQEILLERFDYFIGFVAKEKSELINDYVINLTNKLQNLVEGDFSAKSTKKIEVIFTNYRNLTQNSDLNKAPSIMDVK